MKEERTYFCGQACIDRWKQYCKPCLLRGAGSDKPRRTAYECHLWIFEYFTENFDGDCLLAVGDSELIKIHFHTNQPWKVLEYCAGLGEIYDIVIEDMDRQSRGLQG